MLTCYYNEDFLSVKVCDVCYVYCRRPHPYQAHKKFNSVRPLSCRSQVDTPATDKVTLDSDIANKSVVNKVVCGRIQDAPVLRKALATIADQTSKWSKFLSSEAVNDSDVVSSQLVSDDVGEDCYPVMSGCSTVNRLPSMVSTFSLGPFFIGNRLLLTGYLFSDRLNVEKERLGTHRTWFRCRHAFHPMPAV